MTPEGRIKVIVTRGLKDIQARHPGKLWVRMPVTRGMGRPWLDYHLCASGRTVAIETKRSPEHDLTPQQKATQRELEAAGAKVFRVDNEVTAEFTLRWIEQWINNRP
jgi:hypothetical protein